ncbi:MAG: flavohemoprotein, partial [Pseudonocardiaceae bacterium]
MTADAARDPVPLPDRPPRRTGTATAMVRLIRESYAQIQPRAQDVTQFFYAMLFAIAPATRELFAANMEVQRSRFLRALV